jgi:hypothetical protein
MPSCDSIGLCRYYAIGVGVAYNRPIHSSRWHSLSNKESPIMDKNKLTILACSGSILAATLLTDPSHAMPLQSFGNSNNQVIDGVSLPGNRVNSSQSIEDAVSPLSYERRLQQTALSKFGCGCTNCVGSIRQLVRSGELAI